MKVKYTTKDGDIYTSKNLLKLEIELDKIDSLFIVDNKITLIEGQISQNEEKKWQTLLP